MNSILQEAVEWLASTGNGLWTVEQVSVRRLLSKYVLADMYLGYLNGVPAVTMILQEEDEVFWPSVPKGEWLFLDKLRVRLQFSGTGLAAQMIDWAKQEVNRRGKHFLRLDCASDRERRCRFYECQGFKEVRGHVKEGKPNAITTHS